MRLKLILLLICCSFLNEGYSQELFYKYFEPKSLRVDFTLSGNSSFQMAAIEKLSEEPVWGGPVKNLIEKFNYGGYFVHVYDKESNELIYSRGFNTLFEEWLTTEQAKKETQAWPNSISIPYPKQEIIFELLVRDKQTMQFKSLLKQTIDPQSIFIDRSKKHEHHMFCIQKMGEPSSKVDLVFIAEGYTEAELGKFEADAKRFAESLFTIPPFDSCKDKFNIWGVGLISEESGTDSSGKGIFKNTALNSGYYTFGVDRYLTTPDYRSIRNAVWNVPCDAIFVLVNTDTYGGGGMYNFYAIGSADNERTREVFVHEFGHSFAGLGDEYFSSEVAYNDFYNLKHELWEPNITTLVDFDKKWKDLLSSDTPIPTPLTDQYKNKTGVFEGGGYLSKGIFRPADHCMMRDFAPFCAACTRAILQMVAFLTDEE